MEMENLTSCIKFQCYLPSQWDIYFFCLGFVETERIRIIEILIIKFVITNSE